MVEILRKRNWTIQKFSISTRMQFSRKKLYRGILSDLGLTISNRMTRITRCGFVTMLYGHSEVSDNFLVMRRHTQEGQMILSHLFLNGMRNHWVLFAKHFLMNSKKRLSILKSEKYL